MPMFAKELARLIGRPVLDRTGLEGKYDYVLEWSANSDTTGPSVFTALQEQTGAAAGISKGTGGHAGN